MDYESRGQRFESFRACQTTLQTIDLVWHFLDFARFFEKGISNHVRQGNHLDFSWRNPAQNCSTLSLFWSNPGMQDDQSESLKIQIADTISINLAQCTYALHQCLDQYDQHPYCCFRPETGCLVSN